MKKNASGTLFGPADLIGVINIRRGAPISTAPIFVIVDPVGREILVSQKIDSSGRIAAFVPQPKLRKADLLQEKSNIQKIFVGQEEVIAIQLSRNDFLVGRHIEIKQELAKIINESKISKKPFSWLDVAQFIGNLTLEATAARRCVGNLSLRSVRLAQAWEAGAILSTDARAAAQEQVERARRLFGEKLQPAVALKKSITPGYLICLECGKKLKTLTQHLKATHGLSPDEYRHRWKMPPDYPMIAPDYARHRSALAKKIGFGTNIHAKGPVQA